MGNNNRWAKNTLMLYFRSFLMMFVSLYGVRVLMDYLGIEDYGIYNVVGGVVISLGVINAALSGASSRFISFAIGNGEVNMLEKYYSSIKTIHWLLTLVVLIIGETLGLWLILEKLVIPENRVCAAIICYQMCLLTSLISIVSVPYNALIISYERMDFYAYISIFEALLKLTIIFLLPLINFDKLVVYGVLLFIVQVVIRVCYNVYCKRKFEVSATKVSFDKLVFREILQFAGWTFTGQLAYIGYTQGISILLNMFFGPVVNAARGIANQVQNGAGILAKNLQVAIRPQIIKSWAQGNVDEVQNLVILTTKLGFYLTALTVFPIILCAQPILSLWLKEIPDHTIPFVNLTLAAMFVEVFSSAIIVVVHAVGNIKKFQIYESLVLFLVIPFAYIQLRFLNMPAESVLFMYIIVQIFAQIVRLIIVLPLIKMRIKTYIGSIFPRILISTAFMALPLLFIEIKTVNLLCTLLYAFAMFLYVALIVMIVGLSNSERMAFMNLTLKKLKLKRGGK